MDSRPAKLRLQKLVKRLRRMAGQIETFGNRMPLVPQEGKMYRTFNGSVVFVLAIDIDGEGKCVVLRGGHGMSPTKGESVGDTYMVTPSGWYSFGDLDEGHIIAPELVMSLMEEIKIDLDAMQPIMEQDVFNEEVVISADEQALIDELLDSLDDEDHS